ncbi:MAG TPA: hypothetical protein VM260_01385, partial [Pirellula sp.]|nr:hypothetical protein [Pirellula sp.]
MMKKSSDSKEQNRRNKKLEKKRTIRRAFETPTIRIESKLASPSFVAVVKSVVESLDLFDGRYVPPYVQDFFRNLKQHGIQVAVDRVVPELKSSIEKQANENETPLSKATIDPLLFLAIGLGQVILDRIDKVNENLLPMNDVEVHYF